MSRSFFAVIVCLALASSASAQEWANKMFNTLSHDFGTVARGSKAQFRFQVKNIYEEDAHISSVRTSCNCTTPQVTKQDLKTFETSEIVADFNTRDFLGQKSATLAVIFDKPFPAEVQLHVAGFIHGEVIMQPGALDLGTVDVGKGCRAQAASQLHGPRELEDRRRQDDRSALRSRDQRGGPSARQDHRTNWSCD